VGAFAAGSVVLVPFPFSDLSQSKRRPAILLAPAERGDWILCQITSKSYADAQAIQIGDGDFSQGGLHVLSYARPAKLFTAHEGLFVADIGLLKADSLRAIKAAVITVIQKDS